MNVDVLIVLAIVSFRLASVTDGINTPLTTGVLFKASARQASCWAAKRGFEHPLRGFVEWFFKVAKTNIVIYETYFKLFSTCSLASRFI
jgi:hypothetical protein